MKVLTLTQPWATLVAIGAKRIETRSWKTSYRGTLLIHAAKSLAPIGGKEGYIDFCTSNEYVYRALNEAGLVPFTWNVDALMALPFGKIIAVCELFTCRETSLIGSSTSTTFYNKTWLLDERERAFGDYSPGRYAWYLNNVRRLENPVGKSNCRTRRSRSMELRERDFRGAMVSGTKESCTCEVCQHACEERVGWFLPGEAEIAAAHLGLSFDEFFQRFLVVDYWDDSPPIYLLAPANLKCKPGTAMKWDVFGQCVFLVDGRCSIHAVKPHECKEMLHDGSHGEVHETISVAWNTPESQAMIGRLLGWKEPNDGRA